MGKALQRVFVGLGREEYVHYILMQLEPGVRISKAHCRSRDKESAWLAFCGSSTSFANGF